MSTGTPPDGRRPAATATGHRWSRLLPALALLLVAGCSRPEKVLGQWRLGWDESAGAWWIRSTVDGAEVLRTAPQPLASRTGDAEWEMQFGAYRVDDAASEWRESSAFDVRSESDRVVFEWSGGHRTTVRARDGGLELRVEAPEGRNRLRQRFSCVPSAHFLGFGSQSDAVDHRGHRVVNWVSEPGIGKIDADEFAPGDPQWFITGARHAASYPLPQFLSNLPGGRAWSLTVDSTRRAVFDLCATDPQVWSVEVWDRDIALQLFQGRPLEVVEQTTARFGRQPRANDLALAPWNDAIFGSAKVREVARLLRQERIPSGAIWTEDFRGGASQGDNYRLEEEWDVDRTLYPDVEQVAADLHAQGFRWFAYHNTFLTEGTRVHARARDAGVPIQRGDGSEYQFIGVKFEPTSLVDLTHPQGPGFVTEALGRLIDLGFDGWMADYGEWLPPDSVLAQGNAEHLHNSYPTAYMQASEAALRRHAQPPFATFFARSGTLGSAPHQPVVWAGDQWTNLRPDDGLPTVVTMGLNLGLGGVAIYGHDIGGYQNGTQGPSTRETFFRWTTVGALSPVMRTHHGTKARLNWWFGQDDETLAHFRRWSRLHARLWPYLRAAADEAFDRGTPILRQLALAWPEHDLAWTLHDQYLFGPSILVAPVMTEDALSRQLWLPPGTWKPFWGGESVAGGRTLQVDVPLTEAALYVPVGTILPLLPDSVDTLMPADPPLIDLDDVRGERSLRVYLGADGRWTDVDGTTYTLTSGPVDAIQTIEVAGNEIGDCEAGRRPCVERDERRRTLTVRGDGLREVRLSSGGTTAAQLTSTGPANVTELVFHH